MSWISSSSDVPQHTDSGNKSMVQMKKSDGLSNLPIGKTLKDYVEHYHIKQTQNPCKYTGSIQSNYENVHQDLHIQETF